MCLYADGRQTEEYVGSEYEVSKGIAGSGREGSEIGERISMEERTIVERYGSACALGYTEFLRTFPSVGSSTPDREQPVIGAAWLGRRANTLSQTPCKRISDATRTGNKRFSSESFDLIPVLSVLPFSQRFTRRNFRSRLRSKVSRTSFPQNFHTRFRRNENFCTSLYLSFSLPLSLSLLLVILHGTQ